MPLSWIYSKITGLRNGLYERKWLAIVDLGAKTISVGNITTGGTGKTPLVAHVARTLLARGEKAPTLSRIAASDDEVGMMARHLEALEASIQDVHPAKETLHHG